MGEYICKNCGEECSIVAIDGGIGHSTARIKA
jgi:hypothetical protein